MSKSRDTAETNKIISEEKKNFEEANRIKAETKKISEEAEKIKAEAEKITVEKNLLTQENNQPIYKKKIFWAFAPNFAIWSAIIISIINWVIVPATQIQSKRNELKFIQDSIDNTRVKDSLTKAKSQIRSLAASNAALVKSDQGTIKRNLNTITSLTRKYSELIAKCNPDLQKQIAKLPTLSELHFQLKFPSGTIPLIFATISGIDLNNRNQKNDFVLAPNMAPLVLPYGKYALEFREGSGFKINAPKIINVNQQTQGIDIDIESEN